jgi:hypothetical protein
MIRNFLACNLFARSVPSQRQFRHLVEFANDLKRKNPQALLSIPRLFLLGIQSDLLLSCAENEAHGASSPVLAGSFFAKTFSPLFDYTNYPRLPNEGFKVVLGRDPILPCPWKRHDYANAIAQIGPDRSRGSWRQDSNHSVLLLQPWGVAIVNGGNHSIAAGILDCQGSIFPSYVYDMRKLLDQCSCDGRNYINIQTGKPIVPMDNPRIGALFEVGRMLMEHDLMPMSVTR